MFNFIKIGEVPKTSWSSEDTFNLKPRLKTLMAGNRFNTFGLGETFSYLSNRSEPMDSARGLRV